MEFLSSPDCNKILFTLNSIGVLIPMYDFPEGCKMKISYIIKLKPVEITLYNYESVLMCGEVSSNPIEDLKAITENVSNLSLNILKHTIIKGYYID